MLGFGSLVVCLAATWCFFPRIKKRSPAELRRLATQLVEAAGGSVQICREADRVFEMYSTQDYHLLSYAEATNFTALSRLGNVRGVWFGDPAYVSVRYGDHLDGVFIQIVPKGSEAAARRRTNWVELIEGRIYVHD